MILELPCMDKVFGYAARCVIEKQPMMPFMTLNAMYGDPKYKAEPMCHKWGWFQKPLIEMLQSVGMREIKVLKPHYHFPFRDMRLECVK